MLMLYSFCNENPGNFASLKKIADFPIIWMKFLIFSLKKTKIFEGSFEVFCFSKEASKNFEETSKKLRRNFEETSKKLRKKLQWKLGTNFEVFEFLSSDIKMTHCLQSHLMRKTETSQQCHFFSFTKHTVQWYPKLTWLAACCVFHRCSVISVVSFPELTLLSNFKEENLIVCETLSS
jgi:hypothetical protein